MFRILYLVFFVGTLVIAQQDDNEGGKCERIRLSMCQDLRYNWTAMPNLLGHRDQKEAEEAMSAFSGILASGCSAHARFLLCSAFAPLCSEQVAGAVIACRDLCESVAADCRPRLRELAPALALDCAAFPPRAPGKLCMRPPNASDAEPEPAPHWPLAAVPERCPPAGACAPCGPPLSRPERRAAEARSTALAWASLLVTSFALLTFCAEPSRFRYPERPAVWMAACHAVVAAATVARGWLQAEGGACAEPGSPAAPACVAFFAVSYYFTLAGDAWFANACVAWYLTAASEWSTEALQRASAYLHAAAWGWAGAWAAAALALRSVAGDEPEGACRVADRAVAALEGVPRGALLLASAALGAAACPGVLRVRRALDRRGAARVGRLACRALSAGVAYLLLASLATLARVLEARAREAGGLALLAALQGGRAPSVPLLPAGASACLSLSCGVAAGAWAWSRKSALVWRRALCPPRKAPGLSPSLAPCLAPPLLRPLPPYCKRPLHVSRV